MVIYLDQYRKAKAARTATAHNSAQEKLCVNGNAAIRVIGLPSHRDLKGLSPQLPEDFSKIDIESFHDRVYALASQI